MITTVSEVRVEGVEAFNIIKAIHEKPTANVILNGQKLKAFSLDQEQDKDAHFTTSIQHSIGSASHSNQMRKINKRHPNWKERSKTVIVCR